MDTIIATHELTKIFSGRAVVNRVNLSVPQGAIFALLGGNGAGKSTTIKMLTGLLPADAGTATILGEDCWADAIDLRYRVGYVPERPRFYDWMTVRDIGWFTAGFHEAGFAPRYADLVQRFRLDPAARLKTLSKGGYAKVGLALALAPDPEVLILDEPTSGLDLFIRREFLASMVELAGAGRTILLSSHGIAEVERVASHVGFMAEGRLLLAASIEELRKRIVRVRLHFDGLPPDPADLGQVLQFETSGRLWQAVLQDPNRLALDDLRQQTGIRDLEEMPLCLEEIYTALLTRFHRPEGVQATSNGRVRKSEIRDQKSEVRSKNRPGSFFPDF
ncbi:MAG TPA: ABC transporter ATP-binding protein [Gemmataceae bacterium]|nr:ABC transporter ATP-binding protein [Gemmataceae bacterium]